MTSTNETKLFRTSEVAKELHLSPPYLRQLLVGHEIEPSYHTPGGHRRFTIGDVDRIKAALSRQDKPVIELQSIDEPASAFGVVKTIDELAHDLRVPENLLLQWFARRNLVPESPQCWQQKLAKDKAGKILLFESQYKPLLAMIDEFVMPPTPIGFVEEYQCCEEAMNLKAEDHPAWEIKQIWMLNQLNEEERELVADIVHEEILDQKATMDSCPSAWLREAASAALAALNKLNTALIYSGRTTSVE